ncbi:MAG: IS1182 family transposase [Actinomycetota bacterium]|nr:IS1182 family transposase [Actinomycetota bacterium]
MSLKPTPIGPVPELTAYVARAAFPDGNPYVSVRDALGTFYDDQRFAGLFPDRGQPAEAPWRLALVTVLQFAEGLADRQAADAVRGRIDWKYALGLELTDPGFDFSVLCEFRSRLVAGGAERLLLEAMLETCKARGLVKARTRQRTDSTHVLAAIRTLNRLELVGETLRAALNIVATVAPKWLRAWVPPEWFDRYASRIEESRLPKGEEARYAHGEGIGADGFRLLDALYGEDTPRWLGDLPVVEVLRRVWLAQYYLDEGRVRWRKAGDLPPAGQRIDSPYDPEATFGNKRSTTWTGYKVHLTETCEDDEVHLITNVETTAAVTSDVDQTAPIHTSLAAKGLLPGDHLLDAGYVDAELLVDSQAEHGVRLVGPVRPDVSWQTQAAQGFDISHFVIDWETRQVTCPEGKTSALWQPGRDRWGNEIIHTEFARRECLACRSRPLCTRAKTEGREMTLRPRERHEALQAARQRQETAEWKAEYAMRAGIEGTLSEGVRGFGLRRCRYVGLAKSHLQHVITAAAMNLSRLAAWLAGVPRAKTRTSRFARLARAG